MARVIGNEDAPARLDRSTCERLLRTGYTGRIGFVDEDRPMVLPVNYVFAEGTVVFMTGPGAKLDAALRRDLVAFEVDEIDDEDHSGWSVLIVGRARVLERPDELVWAGSLPLRPWSFGGRRPFWVSVDPEDITGRRLS